LAKIDYIFDEYLDRRDTKEGWHKSAIDN